MPDKPKRTRRTKAQLTAAKLLAQSSTLKEGAAALGQAIQVAPPTNLLGKVSRAVLGAIAVNWGAVTGDGRIIPYPFTISVKVIGREALIEFDYTHIASASHVVLLDDGERDLPLDDPATKAGGFNAVAGVAAPAPPAQDADAALRQQQESEAEEQAAELAALEAEREALGAGDVAL